MKILLRARIPIFIRFLMFKELFLKYFLKYVFALFLDTPSVFLSLVIKKESCMFQWNKNSLKIQPPLLNTLKSYSTIITVQFNMLLIKNKFNFYTTVHLKRRFIFFFCSRFGIPEVFRINQIGRNAF